MAPEAVARIGDGGMSTRTRWGAEQEERTAVAKKAHDAYALGRQAMEKAENAHALAGELRAEIERLRGQIAELRGTVSAMQAIPVAPLEYADPVDYRRTSRRRAA